MSRSDPNSFRLHEEAELFREAVRVTVEKTGFVPRLIEKDYFCGLLLSYLTAADSALVFKGGTCLAKVHAGFHRLSEDLDFSIPLPWDASRGRRRQGVERTKEAVGALADRLGIFRLAEPWQGANNSTQYTAAATYVSLLTGQEEVIRIEVGLREPLLTPTYAGAARTLLLDPVTGQAALGPFELNCLSRAEAYAEKFRAALSRREAAIRDYYDLDHAVQVMGLQPARAELVELVRMKLAVPGNAALAVGEERAALLRRQLEPELRPVLREKDFQQFDLDRAFALVAEMAGRVR